MPAIVIKSLWLISKDVRALKRSSAFHGTLVVFNNNDYKNKLLGTLSSFGFPELLLLLWYQAH